MVTLVVGQCLIVHGFPETQVDTKLKIITKALYYNANFFSLDEAQ